MNDKINRVLADRPQAFTTAEQKQARDNIGAQKSLSYSYSGSTITAIDESAVGSPGALTGIAHDSNLSGSGTSGSPLGLASSFVLSSSGLPYTMTASPASVEFFNGNDLDRFASYNLSGAVLSASGASPTTSRLNDSRLGFYESGKPSAYYGRSGLRLGTTADVMTTLSRNLKFDLDVGGNLESTTYMAYGFSGTMYTPTGTNHDTGVIGFAGISGVNGFGDYKIWDNWRSSKRAQLGNTGDEKSVIDMYIGYNNGEEELYPAYIGFYNPYDGSAFIYQSSISSWNNKMDNVNVGFGLSGNGKDSALGVTACSGEFKGIHSDYFYALTSRDLVFSSYDKDNEQLETKTVFNEYGMRMSAHTAGKMVTLQDDGFRMEADASSLTASLDHGKLRMSDSGGYADLTKSSIDAIAAVYNWATSQGMTPIN